MSESQNPIPEFAHRFGRQRTLGEVLFEPRPGTITAFLAGLIGIGLIGDLLFVWLTGNAPPRHLLWRVLIAIGVCAITAWISYQMARRRGKQVRFDLEEKHRHPNKRRGLVWLLAPSGYGHAMTAIRHHFGDGSMDYRLQQCWIILERGNAQVDKVFEQLRGEVIANGIDIGFHPIYVADLGVRATYDALLQIVEHELPGYQMTCLEVIVDITGGTKPMTAGLILGALSTDCLLQYVETDRDEQGRALPETARVVIVSRQVYLDSYPSASANN